MQAEVALCQRYYQVTGALIQLSAYASANGQTSYQTFVFPVSMRTGPTCSNTWASGVNNAGQTTANVAYNHVQLKVTANAAGSFSVQYSAGNTFDAEL